jgi:hypothetical protein
MRLSIGRDSTYLGLGLEAKDGDMGLEAACSLGRVEGGGGTLIAGPGSASGALRILVDPTSGATLSRSSLVELDRSFASRGRVLCIGGGPISLFALSKGRGLARELEAAAAGLSFGLSAPGGGFSALAAASFSGPGPSSDTWCPDPGSSPALNAVDGYHPCLSAALLAERRRASGSALAGIGASYGHLAGPGLALRLQSTEILGPLSLSLAAGAASDSFRELAGPRQERLFGASAEARLAMRRASSLSASIEAEARGRGLLYTPLWGRKGALKLILPVGAEGRLFDTGFEAESPTEGMSGGSWSMGLARRAREGGCSSSMWIGAALRWESAMNGVKFSLKTELEGEGGLPHLGLDLDIDTFDGGSAASPFLATGGASLELPCGRGAALELLASLPEEGTALSPGKGEGKLPTPDLRLRYRASISLPSPPAARRPRSRISTTPKASSIAQRAAS